jgi:predicted aspartyl protease
MKSTSVIAATFFLGLALPVGPAAADAQEPSKKTCDLLQDESLDMSTLPSGGIAITASLNGKPLTWQVDTGSDASSVTYEAARELALNPHFTNRGGAFLNNISIVQYAKLDSLGLGRLSSRGHWDVLIIPNMMALPEISGLMGADVLRNYDVEFDFYRGKLKLFEHNTCPAPVYWTKGPFAKVPITLDESGHIVAAAMLDDKPVSLLFDTGSPISAMSVDAARSLFGWAENETRLKSLGTIPINGGADTPLYSFPFGSLNFEGVAVAHPNIQLMPQKNFMAADRGPAQIVLGMTVLRQLHVYVGYNEKNLYLTDAEAQ